MTNYLDYTENKTAKLIESMAEDATNELNWEKRDLLARVAKIIHDHNII